MLKPDESAGKVSHAWLLGEGKPDLNIKSVKFKVLDTQKQKCSGSHVHTLLAKYRAWIHVLCVHGHVKLLAMLAS